MTLTRIQASQALPRWRYVLGRMHLRVETGSFAKGLELVNAIGEIAESMDHHPEIDLRYGVVHLAVFSHDAGGITDRDIRFGEAVTALLDQRNIEPSYGRLTEFAVAIDALDVGAVLPFWKAVSGHDLAEDNVLVDPDRVMPSIWFQEMTQPRTERNRIHLDIAVAHEEARERMRAGLEAGGRLIDDSRAPDFWVLADPEGNEVCICSWQTAE